jgi:hypothetical protein
LTPLLINRTPTAETDEDDLSRPGPADHQSTTTAMTTSPISATATPLSGSNAHPLLPLEPAGY